MFFFVLFFFCLAFLDVGIVLYAKRYELPRCLNKSDNTCCRTDRQNQASREKKKTANQRLGKWAAGIEMVLLSDECEAAGGGGWAVSKSTLSMTFGCCQCVRPD